ncbi:MAG TPA: glycosyltransferase [Dehalococcoidia bacterium]|nr:glycosyltransferase [Dehalococcoidia bacterium]
MVKKKALYLSYTGMLEPLGRSQILAYLSRLADEYQFTIISFEKPEDYAKPDEVEALRIECEQWDIDWRPKIYHHRPRLLATLWDLLILITSTWQHSHSGNVRLVHCRSYIPSIAAWLVGKVTKTPFIFDMRALWPEEMIEADHLKRDSLMHKTIVWFEKKLLTDAAHVVSLTQAAVFYLKKLLPELRDQNFSVIPTCVELDKFKFNPPMEMPVKLGTMGTVISGWYHLDWLFSTFQCELKRNPHASFKIVTRDSNERLVALAKEYGIPQEVMEVISSTPQEIAANIADMRAGLLYFTSGTGKLGSAPTRMGEFLACGIPVIGNRGVGDMADLIERYSVGVVVDDGQKASIAQALIDLDELYEDDGLQLRCRRAAEDYFSADTGAEKYRSIYTTLG